jgi:hypothetical protein
MPRSGDRIIIRNFNLMKTAKKFDLMNSISWKKNSISWNSTSWPWVNKIHIVSYYLLTAQNVLSLKPFIVCNLFLFYLTKLNVLLKQLAWTLNTSTKGLFRIEPKICWLIVTKPFRVFTPTRLLPFQMFPSWKTSMTLWKILWKDSK